METKIIDMLFLELAQFTNARIEDTGLVNQLPSGIQLGDGVYYRVDYLQAAIKELEVSLAEAKSLAEQYIDRAYKAEDESTRLEKDKERLLQQAIEVLAIMDGHGSLRAYEILSAAIDKARGGE